MTKDILIIGGGPSGLSTALHLAKIAPHLTPRILILEKENYPRHKLCAGGLVADAEVILRGLGLDAAEVPHVDARAAHFDFGGRGINIRMPGSHIIRVIRRNEFDAWLAGKARGRGIEIREGVSVRKVAPHNNGVTVETDQGTFEALLVVGADGSNGITRRCILPHDPVQTARVLEVITPQRANIHAQDEAYFDFFPVPHNIAGYVWDFPTQVNGQTMRCWGVYDTNLLADQPRPPLKQPLAEEMVRLGYDLDDYELKGHPIRWYAPDNKVSVPRVLLAGDAVGADAIFGEGISIALGYGAIAAREISTALKRNDLSFRGYKRRIVFSELGQTLLARWVITQIIYSFKWRWFQFLLWRMLKPVVILVAWVFVLNWGKRLKT